MPEYRTANSRVDRTRAWSRVATLAVLCCGVATQASGQSTVGAEGPRVARDTLPAACNAGVAVRLTVTSCASSLTVATGATSAEAVFLIDAGIATADSARYSLRCVYQAPVTGCKVRPARVYRAPGIARVAETVLLTLSGSAGHGGIVVTASSGDADVTTATLPVVVEARP